MERSQRRVRHTLTIRFSYTRKAEFENGKRDMRSTKAGESKEGRVVREAPRMEVRKHIKENRIKGWLALFLISPRA